MKNILIIKAMAILALLSADQNGSGASTDCFHTKSVPETMENPVADDENFVNGLDNFILYCPARDGDKAAKKLSMATCGKNFDVFALYYMSGTVVAIDDLSDGHKSIAMEGGRISESSNPGCSYPLIGVNGNGSIKTAEYVIAAHDFTGDDSPELLIAVRDKATSGMAVYILEYVDGAYWRTIGSMVSKGKGIDECRIFRQTVSFKSEASGTLYTWTCHNGHFDFLASNHLDDPAKLY